MIKVANGTLLLAVGVFLAGTAVSQAGGDKKLTSENFLAKTIDCNTMEKNLAEKAVKNAQSEAVRKYAQQLIADHKKLNVEAKDLAKNMKVGIVTGLSPEYKVVWAKLLTATGKDFDRQFIHFMVTSHEKAVKMFEHCSKDSANAQIRTFATQALPILRDHLAQARKLDKSLNNK